MNPPPRTRAEGLTREWAKQLRRGLIQVLTARDPAPAAHSRRGRAAVAVAAWLGLALLVVALLGAVEAVRHRAGLGVGPNGLVGSWRPRALEDAEVFALLLLVLRYPLFAWRIGYASVLLVPFAADEARVNLPIAGALLITYWVAGLRHGRAVAWAMWVLMMIPVWLWVRPGLDRPLLATAVLVVIAVALDAISVSRHAGRALAARVAQSELEEAHRSVLEERTRIAREMHDVVAHHMSMIAVQAETAPYRLGELPTTALDEFASLSGAAREP